MLANFMPAAVLINEKFDVVQFRGSTETWLTPPDGRPSFNLLKMAREGLSFELRNLLHLAQKTTQPVRKFSIFFKVNDLQQFVNIQALQLTQNSELHYLVIFQPASSTGIQPNMFDTGQSTENTNYNASELRIEHLERELIQTRADMRAVTDAQETANEELQSANEELLSGSEELQSLNEELETSTEELQSINEEIIIVNKELLERNEQLNNSRLYTEGIVNTIRDPLLILDKNLRVKRATRRFYTKFNINEHDTEGRYIYEIGSGLWNIPKLHELLDKVLPAKKELDDFEITQVFPSLGKRIMCLSARQFDNLNGEALILLAIEDITDKRKVEEGLAEAEQLLNESRDRLKFAVDSAGLGTWDYDPQTKELICDGRCKGILGLEATGSVNLPFFYEMFHPDDRAALANKINEVLSNRDHGEFDVEYRTIPADGKFKWLKAKGRAYFDEQVEPIRLIGTLLDITAQKLIDATNVELLRKKDEFISIASHELRTPITSLKLMLQVMERTTVKSEEMKAFILVVRKSIKQVDKLVGLIKDLLEVTNIQSGKLELQKTTFLLDDLVRECTEQLQMQSPGHQLIIEGDTDISVNADRNRMEQVFVNLLSNAIKYSPEADKAIIRVERLNGSAKVSVIDFGIGIPADKFPMIFDRFYRVDEKSQRYAGLGLGLYISSEIIRRHNGHIDIKSEVGKGSTFWFEIPV